mgnify:CR=1 FL=1
MVSISCCSCRLVDLVVAAVVVMVNEEVDAVVVIV